MNSRLALALTMTLALLLISARAAPPLDPATEEAARAYAHLLDAARADPVHADWTAVRHAYAASPAYDPAAGGSELDMRAAAAFDRHDRPLALALADQAVGRNWMNLRAHMIAFSALDDLPNAERRHQHRLAASAILRAIAATGTGMSPATAYENLAQREEFSILAAIGRHSVGLTQIRENGHVYDRIATLDEDNAHPAFIWFNTDARVARQAALKAGAPLIHDPDLPR